MTVLIPLIHSLALLDQPVHFCLNRRIAKPETPKMAEPYYRSRTWWKPGFLFEFSSNHRTYPMTFIAWWISRRGDVCGPRFRCSSTCRALVVGLLATECSLLPVWRSGTVCHTLLTVFHWHHSAVNWKLFCLLYHFHDYIFLFSGPWGVYFGHFENFLCV